MAANPKILQLEPRKEMFSAKYGLTGEVRQRTSSYLATIVSRALLLQDGRIPCPVDGNLDFFLTSQVDFLFIFEQCGDNCK